MDKYKTGTIFQLYENDEQLYLVVNCVELESGIYILVVPVDSTNKNLKIEYSKVMLLKADKKTDEITIETDEQITRKVINESVKQMNNNG